MTTQLTILNTSIRTLNNLFSLNDLHKISGGEEKHKPTRFMRLDQTQDLIIEIQKDKRPDLVFKVTAGCGLRGTYACEELAPVAYATWISPKFHLVVL